MENSERITTEVDTDWLLRVRDFLWRIAHETGELAADAECLGSFIPGFIDEGQRY